MLPLYGEVITNNDNVTNEDSNNQQSSSDVTYIGVMTDEYGHPLYGFPVR